jgi:transposase InsO family protein
LISLDEKRRVLELIQEAAASGARKKKACEAIGISIKSLQRWNHSCTIDGRKGAEKKVPRKLTEKERQKVKDTACAQEYKDLNPYEIVALLAEKGSYIASERTFYRILKADGLLHYRGNAKPANKKSQPDELVATGPDHVWSWDITWLKTEVRGLFYYAYVIKDIWTKDIVGWEIHDREDDSLAGAMFKRLKLKHSMNGICLRSDNGNPMKGATMLMTLYNLGVIPSYSRPRVSNDNPFIESLFKTLKYTAGYPGQFKDIEHSRAWMANFVNWYNTEHRHSAIGYVTPEQRRSGAYKEIFEKRNDSLALAMEKNPERWGKKKRVWGCDDKVYLNLGKETKEKLIKKIA